jgi:hypothetical protein
MKKNGSLILTQTTFRKSTIQTEKRVKIGYGSVIVYQYRGREYRAEWLLTYSHKQYYLMLPVTNDLEVMND